jgi:hypothetical protein
VIDSSAFDGDALPRFVTYTVCAGIFLGLLYASVYTVLAFIVDLLKKDDHDHLPPPG